MDGWKKQNLLIEVMLMQGFPLDSLMRQHPNFTENQVFQIHSEFCDHDLYVCLDAQLSQSTIEKAVLYAHDIFICLTAP